MTPDEAYDWLAPKLSTGEREALDVVMGSLRALRQPRTDLDVRAIAAAAALDGDEYHADKGWLERMVALVANSEVEACASLLEVSNSGLRLMAGEMTAQELRTAQAILAAKASEIRRRRLPGSFKRAQQPTSRGGRCRG